MPTSKPVAVLTVALCAAALVPSPVQAGDAAGKREPVAAYRSPVVTAPNPSAPPETAQFAFLVGVWDCKTRFLGRDGKTFTEGTAVWSGEWILDGWAIQDWWVSDGPNRTSHGTNIRSFNPRTGKWDNRWLASGALQWKFFAAEKTGDTMVMTGGEGTDARGAFIDRNTFYDIDGSSWMWRKDRSWDGGKTWFEGIGFIEASRRK